MIYMKRMGAYSIDIFIASIFATIVYFMLIPLMMYIPREIIMHFINGRDALRNYLFLVFLYYLISECIFNGTIGKYMFGLRIVDKKNEKPKIYRRVVRNIFRITDQLLLVGSILLFMSNGHQRLGDKIAGTKLVEKTKKN